MNAGHAPLRIGFIGNGGIARSVCETLAGLADVESVICGILSRSPLKSCGPYPALANVEALLAAKPDVIVECAGHGAVVQYGETILRAGIKLIIVSIGALADPGLHAALVAAAGAGRSQLILAPGAMSGIDALAAARLGGLARVRYVGSKPPCAWHGTKAETMVDLGGLTQPSCFFSGTARQAALDFPKNSNVCATIALAGLGFDHTEVELVADPGVAKNVHRLIFEGADGRFDTQIVGEPSRSNPKTSALTAHSIVRLLHGLVAPVVM